MKCKKGHEMIVAFKDGVMCWMCLWCVAKSEGLNK